MKIVFKTELFVDPRYSQHQTEMAHDGCDDLLSTVGGAHLAAGPTVYEKLRESLCLSPSTELHGHQQAALAWMLNRESNEDGVLDGGILADGPGLGKTLTMLSVIQMHAFTRPSLVVVPNQIIAQQWYTTTAHRHLCI